MEIRLLKVRSLKNYHICVCYVIVYDLKAFVYSPEYRFLLRFKSSILNLFNIKVSLLMFDNSYILWFHHYLLNTNFSGFPCLVDPGN